ncbi:MAG: SMC-Scp complex subunit ScpB [Spirochaetes bacterium]|nr:SMC-Scp complex subunit ScpB [Spirochaetota bacterium]
MENEASPEGADEEPVSSPPTPPAEAAAPAPASLEQRIESLLFLENRGLLEGQVLSRKCGAPLEEIVAAVARLNAAYRDSASVLEVIQLETGFRLTLRPDFNDPVLDDYRPDGKKKMSRALLETLVIIAYKQPVTRAEIEGVRGVNSAAYIKMLLDDGVVKIAGRKNGPGRPVLYKTTPKFLLTFGLKSLSDLPTPKDVKSYEFLEERAQSLAEPPPPLDADAPQTDS